MENESQTETLNHAPADEIESIVPKGLVAEIMKRRQGLDAGAKPKAAKLPGKRGRPKGSVKAAPKAMPKSPRMMPAPKRNPAPAPAKTRGRPRGASTRYSEDKKKEMLDWLKANPKKSGKIHLSAAVKKFGISYLTLKKFVDAAGLSRVAVQAVKAAEKPAAARRGRPAKALGAKSFKAVKPVSGVFSGASGEDFDALYDQIQMHRRSIKELLARLAKAV